MKIAIYVRVSTEEQHTDNQLKILKEYCKNNKYIINGIYIDKGESGLKEKRPNFDRLMHDMRARKFEAIVIWKLDRIGRSLQHLLNILQEIKNKKVNLIVTSQNIDTTTASGKLLFHIMGAFAEFEADLISERTKLAYDTKKNRAENIGQKVKWGRNKKILSKEEIDYVNKKRGEGMSWRKNADLINENKKEKEKVSYNKLRRLLQNG